jgi:DNA polymerase-3 subunit beta
MKFLCGKNDLVDAIHKVGRVITTRTTLPILNNILLTPVEGGVQLAAYDLKLAIRTFLPVAGVEPPGIALPCRLFSEIVSAFPGDEVVVESDPQTSRARVSCGRSNYNIHGMPSQEFPSLPELPGESTLILGQETLKGMIRQTEFASAKEETRPPMTGTLFLLEDDSLTMVTTDTYRLAARKQPLGKEHKAGSQLSGGPIKAIIPTRALQEMERLLGVGKEEVSITLGTNLAQFSLGDFKGDKHFEATTTLVSNLIEGHFPDHAQVIQPEWQNRVTVKTKDLETALRRVELVARENANRVILRVSEGCMQLQAVTQGVGEAKEEIDIKLEGDGLTVGFNARYLIDVLSVVDSEDCRLVLRGSTNPGMIEPVSDVDYKYVLMPVILREEEK